jgi:hypothetical protein
MLDRRCGIKSGPNLAAAGLASAALLLSACSDDAAPVPQATETDIPEELQSTEQPVQIPSEEAGIGTPMEERVATIGVLNKRNNVAEDLQLTPGESRRLGNVIVRLQACERTAPWEMPQETGAFVQVLVMGAEGPGNADGERGTFGQIFSGWVFKNSPSLNVVEHPVYDVWVKDCAMSFPGEGA